METGEQAGIFASSFLPSFDNCTDELTLLQSAIDDDPPATLQNTGIIRAGHSPELDGVIEASRHAREWINNLEPAERQRTGIKTLKVGYNKVFGYYIEISHGQAANAPPTTSASKRWLTPNGTLLRK